MDYDSLFLYKTTKYIANENIIVTAARWKSTIVIIGLHCMQRDYELRQFIYVRATQNYSISLKFY